MKAETTQDNEFNGLPPYLSASPERCEFIEAQIRALKDKGLQPYQAMHWLDTNLEMADSDWVATMYIIGFFKGWSAFYRQLSKTGEEDATNTSTD